MKELDFDLVTTRGGDKGESFTYDGQRKIKYDDIFETVGDLDELNLFLGIVRNLKMKQSKQIAEIQNDILHLSSQIATDPSYSIYESFIKVTEKDIYKLEKWQKKLMKDAVIPQVFILPGEAGTGSEYIDIARSVCRRAERHIVKLIREHHRIDLFECQKYVNRLSDFLFVLARYKDSL